MPNYCDCDLWVDGSDEDIDRLVAVVGSETDAFNFSKIIPYPQAFADRDADRTKLNESEFLAKYGSRSDGFNSGGYDWCVQNWGTKWDACRSVMRKATDCPLFRFSTAWAPPLPVIKRLAELFPELMISLEYFEQGCEYCGGVTYVSKDEWYGDGEWEPGKAQSEWRLEGYRGRRGG
jgi:hypothetical protein